MNKNLFLTYFLSITFFLAMPLIAEEIDEDQDDGFPFWTLVQTERGVESFSRLKKSDRILSVKQEGIAGATALEPEVSQELRTLYYVYVSDEIIVCGGATRFFVINKGKWVQAAYLEDGDLLISNQGNKLHAIQCEGSQETDMGDVLLRMKIDSPTHCYFIGQHSILVHNHVPVISLGIIIPFGEGAAVGGAAGSFWGPITITVGATIGGIFALGWSQTLGDTTRESIFVQDADDLKDVFERYSSFPGDAQYTSSTGEPEDPKGPQKKQGPNREQPPKNNFENESNDNIRKRIRGEEKQAKIHEKKVEDYKKNPDAHDNKGYLKNAPNTQERERRYNRRIEILENQIKGFYDRAKELKDILKSRGEK